MKIEILVDVEALERGVLAIIKHAKEPGFAAMAAEACEDDDVDPDYLMAMAIVAWVWQTLTGKPLPLDGDI